jgi:putative hydrolase of the HAD superfamily
MNHIRAIGFDLFNTLIFVEPHAIDTAVKKLTDSLMEGGVVVEHDPFRIAHLEAALQFLETARGNGRETHNRFWISAALERLGRPSFRSFWISLTPSPEPERCSKP